MEPNSELCHRFFLEYHATPEGGHSGYQHTLQRIKQSFCWSGMKSYVKKAVKECDVRRRNKHENVSPLGLLQPLPVPDNIWEDITMDFVEGLPLAFGKNSILVVVDRLTKFTHFVALKHPFTAQQVAKELFTKVLKLYGIPKFIISDTDRIFLSEVWHELFQLQGTTLKPSTFDHPQTNGQMKRVNQSLEIYLRCFGSMKP